MSEVKNESGILPCGRAVLVEPYEPERKKSLIALPDEVEDNLNTLGQRAVVIQAGPSAWHEEQALGYPPRAVPGDKVLISKFSGQMFKGTADGKQYRLVNDRDIFAKIEVENNGN
jgi:co-chaperonin GroES (HSP10)